MPENTKDSPPNPSPQSLSDLMKICRKCGKEFPATLEFFYKNAGGKYGVTPRCKPCVNEDNKEAHARRLTHEPEKLRAQATARSQKYYYQNLEKARETSRLSAAKARQDPEKRLKIYARKRAAGAGLTPEELEAMFAAQGNACAICTSTDPGSKIGWNVDHCHATGQVRFVLCAHCNRGLGGFRDNPAWLRKAADMLEEMDLLGSVSSSVR